MSVAFHVVGPEIRHFVEIGILAGVERAAAGDQDRFGQRAVRLLDAPVFFKVFSDDGAAAGRQGRAHGGAAGAVIILVSFRGLLSAVAGGHDAGAGNDHVGFHAAVGAGAAAGIASQTLVHAVVIAFLLRSADDDGALGGRLVVELGSRIFRAVVVVAGGMTDQKVVVLPHQPVVVARAGIVASAAAAAEAAVHDAGAGFVHDLVVLVVAGQDAAAAGAGAEHVKARQRRHAAVEPVAHLAVAKGAAGHVAAVAAGVAPVVVSAPLVGDGGCAAADDQPVIARIVRVHVGDPAVVKPGVLDADHLTFAAVAFQMEIVDVGHRFRPDVVAFRHRDLVFLDEADFRHLRQFLGLAIGHVGDDARFEIARRQFVIVNSKRFQFLDDLFPVISFQGADQDLEGLLFALSGHAVREGQLVFRQIRRKVRELKARLQVVELRFLHFDDVSVREDKAVHAHAEARQFGQFLRREVRHRRGEVESRAIDRLGNVFTNRGNAGLRGIDGRLEKMDGTGIRHEDGGADGKQDEQFFHKGLYGFSYVKC